MAALNIIKATELADYLGVGLDKRIETLTSLANGLVSEAWRNQVTPIPTTVKSIALEVAARPGRNPKGLSSWTRSVDDASRTERLSDAAARAGVYLTADERTQLRGSPLASRAGRVVKSIGTRMGLTGVQRY